MVTVGTSTKLTTTPKTTSRAHLVNSATCANVTVIPIDSMIATSAAIFSSLIRPEVSISFSANGHRDEKNKSGSEQRDGQRSKCLAQPSETNGPRDSTEEQYRSKHHRQQNVSVGGAVGHLGAREPCLLKGGLPTGF